MMISVSLLRHLVVVFILSLCLPTSVNAASLNKTGAPADPNTFSVLACITWWAHDAVGYHPAMYLFLENTSGHSITGAEIPFQGRFTDLHNEAVSVAREYRRGPIRDHERLAVFLKAPQSYELPIDSGMWPTIECKAMCRLDNANVEDLYIGHVNRITMSDEEAEAQLVAQAGRNPLLSRGKRTKDSTSAKSQPEQSALSLKEVNDNEPPLRALPNTIGGATDKNATLSTNDSEVSKIHKKVANKPLPKYLPPVGSDFYAFDKLYGGAKEVQTPSNTEDLTWTHYKASNMVKDIFVASHNACKSDVIILVLDSNLKDKEITGLAKLLAHCGKSEPISPLAHSVRYLSKGRSEIMTTAIRDSKILAFKIKDTADAPVNTVIVVSRLPGDLDIALSNYISRVNFLRFLGS